jgi:DNA-binding LacI/PurR family transcriptional regulator
MSKDATLNQVAAYAGVSIATASRCFSHPEVVKEATVEKILAAALALNYKAPRVLERDRSVLRIAVFTSMFSHHGDLERLRGIMNALRAVPHELLLFDIGENSTSIEHIKRLAVTKRIDGIVIVDAAVPDDVSEYLNKFRIPAVLIDRDDTRFTRVITSDTAGGRVVAEYFNSKSPKKILFVGDYSQKSQTATALRLKAFRDALDRKKNSITAELLVDVASSEYLPTIQQALIASPQPDAVFTASDELALDVVKLCAEIGLKIPEQISLVSYGDTDTAIRRHFEASGRRAIELLRSNPEARTREELPLELVIRQSTS